MTQPTDYERKLRAEIAAIRRIVAVLDKLDQATQERIVRYLVDRYETAATDRKASA
jgi:hypothetical protein